MIRVLIVDDYGPWRSFVRSTLEDLPGLQVVGEVSDGLEAVQRAQTLQPDLILLDIGLPTLNGIEAARRIRGICPLSKMLFLSENRSADIAGEALRTGASGYVVKSEAGNSLLPAVKAVLNGDQFLSAGLSVQRFRALNDHAEASAHCHEIAFYKNDRAIVDGYVGFVESALKVGHAVIAVVIESHQASMMRKLEADGVDVAVAIEQGSYTPLDPVKTLPKLMVNNMPDPQRCAQAIGDLIMGAARGGKKEHARVSVCGEIAPTLLSTGNAEGAIQLEHLWDEITRGYGVRTLCGYLRNAVLGSENSSVFERICAEHSFVYGKEFHV